MTTTALPTTNRTGQPHNPNSSYRTEAGLARRVAGMTWQQIADEVGYRSPGMAEAAVMRYVAWLQGNPSTGTRRSRRSLATAAIVTFTRSFGVELEFQGIRLSTAAAAVATVVGYQPAITGYHQSGTPDFTRWHVERDGSVTSARGIGGEVVSPVLNGSAGIAEMRLVMKALAATGARVTVKCGMHVHVNALDLTGEQISRLIAVYVDRQAAMNELVSPSRRTHGYGGNGYCRPVSESEKIAWGEQFKQDGQSTRPRAERYRTVNVTSFTRTGTIEFRQHQGTMNASKAAAWVEMLLSMVNAVLAAQDETLPTTAPELIDALRPFGLTASSARNLLGRLAA